jgi:hypothetical protein
MPVHLSLLIIGLIAAALHCLIRVLRWRGVSDGYAMGVYSVVFPNLPDPSDLACVRVTRNTARTFERELRWHTGTVARGYSPVPFRLQWLTIVAAFLCIWFSGASHWWLLIPVGAGVTSWAYFHVWGWHWLQAGCNRYRNQKRQETL